MMQGPDQGGAPVCYASPHRCQTVHSCAQACEESSLTTYHLGCVALGVNVRRVLHVVKEPQRYLDAWSVWHRCYMLQKPSGATEALLLHHICWVLPWLCVHVACSDLST